MKNLIQLSMLFLLSNTAIAQYTETFEFFTAGATSFISNGKSFTITSVIPNTSAFDIGDYSGYGWNGSAVDNKFIDNSGTGNAMDANGAEFTISSASPFTLKKMYLYLSRSNTTFTSLSGSCTITGKLGGNTVFTVSQSTPFNSNTNVNNGFTLIDMTNYGGNNNAAQAIDAFTVKTTSNIGYVALDAMTWATASSISTSITGSSFCSGATIPIGYTSSGYTFATGNIFTAQLSDASGSFASPVTLGTLNNTANSGTIMATLPVGTLTGSGYRVRVVASNPSATGVDNGSNLIITKTSFDANTSYLANLDAIKTVTVTGTGLLYYTDNDCRAIAGLTPNGAAPVTGTTSVKVWINNTQPVQYVRRHYEITPTNNAATASGRITLYFTQADFNAFNAVNTTKLPQNSSDATGIANLLIEKRSGTGNATGDLNSFTGTKSNINPNDADIVWNANSARWEVSFDITGFSGFWVKTQSQFLPVDFDEVQAVWKNDILTVNFTTHTETNNDHFEVEISTDGVKFKKAATIASKNKDGNTSSPTNYQVDIKGDVGGLVIGISIMLLGMVLGTGTMREKKKDWLPLLMIIAGASIGTLSCSKQTDAVDDIPNTKIYVRIVQVDKDGTTNYSKVIQAIRE